MSIRSRPNSSRRPYVRLLPVLVAGFASVVPLAEAAAQAQLFIHPTLIMFSGTERSETVHIVNQGDATGVFELAWVDYAMTPEGGLSARDGAAPWSLQPFARYSPRRVTLRPGETQLVRVALRAGDAAEAEYYSHLRVVTLEDDLRAAAAGNEATVNESVTIEARTAVAIPIIWRNSDAAPRASIESAEFNPATSDLVVEMRRLGALSTRGYLHVLSGPFEDAASRPLAQPVPVVIYPSTERRIVTVPLGTTVDSGLLAGAEVIYAPDLEITTTGDHYAAHKITASDGTE